MASWHRYVLVSVSVGELGTARWHLLATEHGLFWEARPSAVVIFAMADPPSPLLPPHTVPGAYGAESIATLWGAGRSCELFPHLFWGPLKFCCCSEIQ